MPDEYDDDPRQDAPLTDIASDANEIASETNETDQALSSLVDGELDAQGALRLREQMALTPELSERLDAFERLDGALRGLSGSQVPADLTARMRQKIAQERAGAASPVGTSQAVPSRRARTAPPRRTRRLWPAAAGLAAAVAAALAVYLLVPTAGTQQLTPESAPQLEAHPPLLASAGDDELGIALYYDELADLEMLEQLELLEILAAIDEAEQS